MRRLSATPCPVSDHTNRRDSIFSISNDTTANLDFTTEFKASFRDVKPRRPPAAGRKRAGNNAAWTIHEDEELKLEPTLDAVANQPGPSRLPRLDSRRVSAAPREPKMQAATSLSKAPRRLSIRPQVSDQRGDGDTIAVHPVSKITKPARRGTVYIPSEDTTMPTMFMDIFSPLRRAPPAQDQAEPDVTGLAMEMRRRKGSRKSILAASPKRGPLQPALNVQAAATTYDRFGQGSGKENVPPGSIEGTAISKHQSHGEKIKKPREDAEDKCQPTRRIVPSRIFEPTASSNARVHEKRASQETKPKPAWNSNFLLPKPRRPLQQAIAFDETGTAPSESELTYQKPHIPRRTLVPTLEPVVLPEYEFLPEGVVDVSMYEEGWLNQQEVALTQLLNQLFCAASPTTDEGYRDDFQRIQLAEIYGQPSMAALYKRLQDCMTHGALGVSQDVLAQGCQLHADLGRRKAFTDFWLANYDPQLLHSCLEVVVGRVIPSRISAGGQSPNAKDMSREQHAVRRYIERFLICNEDVTRRRDSIVSSAALYRRTILRCLMLVKLLDLVKSESRLRTKAMLFKPGSELKCSPSALTHLMRMLNPSGGDPIRSLRSIGYQVSHVQHPLEEFQYTISNMAVDLRDGVRLTRLVELLLYRSASQALGHVHDLDATTTITIPTGDTVVLGEGHQDWPLSQHLKFPCNSRATKLYNVQLALSALKEVKGMSAVLQEIEPADIVDGFREKTVRLLWGMSSKWGLGGLVDWEDVRSEVRRLGRSTGRIGHLYLEEFNCEDEDEGYMQYKNLLKAWVKAVALSRGLRVRNFTSDFADGRLFGALVSEYQPLLTSFGHGDCSKALPDRLRALGCSEQFGLLFVPVQRGSSSIFDRDFVLASIAFLCSRLLSPTKKARAAVTLQRAWRSRWNVVLTQRKKVLQGVALACANEVRRRNAKICIWRAWCEFRARRQARTRPVQASEADIWLSL